MFERPDAGERAVLVHLELMTESEREDPQEFKELVISAGVEPVALVQGSRAHPSPVSLLARESWKKSRKRSHCMRLMSYCLITRYHPVRSATLSGN